MTKSKLDRAHTHSSDALAENARFGAGVTDMLQLQQAVAEATQEILSTATRFGMRRIAAVGEYATTLGASKLPADVAMANFAYWQRYFADIAEHLQEAVKTTHERAEGGLKLAAE